jgi:hypothetical protein
MELPLPSEVVAAVTRADGTWLGTAFFVGPTTALTCAHVVGDLATADLRLQPVLGADLVPVDDVVRRPASDLARMEVTPETGAWLPLRSSWSPGTAVVSHGFSTKYPRTRFPYGHPMDRTEISGEVDVEWKEARSRVLRLGPSNADAGFSGGPLVDVESGAVVGVLRFRLAEEGGTYAIPASTVLDQWPDLASLGDVVGNPFRRAWRAFDPGRLHAVVIDAEAGAASSDHLSDTVRELFSQSVTDRIWAAFRSYWSDRSLLATGAPRGLADRPSAADIRLATLGVTDALSSRSRLAEAIRLIVEADVAFFDVTDFEPGTMLLLGVRGATRRGVTITSHGSWLEGSPLDRPFNLADLSLTSHRGPTETIGPDPRMTSLGDRVVDGFTAMANLVQYQDLPAYDGIRQLGPRPDAWSTIPLDRLVLVLCSYDAAFYEDWKLLRRQIASALSELDQATHVARLIDLRRPQLVSQALYELLRRCSACVTDWTGWSPSTFFELGARLAISPWGSVQVVDDQWLAERDDDDSTRRLDQHKSLTEIFAPLGYRGKDDDTIGGRVARELVEIKRTAGVAGGHFIRSVVLDALTRVQEARPDVVQALVREADSLHHAEQQSSAQALFAEIIEAKVEQERAALDRRIAAWLYLEHRVEAGSLPEDHPTRRLWRSLGDTVLAAMYSVAPDDPLIDEIELRLGP